MVATAAIAWPGFASARPAAANTSGTTTATPTPTNAKPATAGAGVRLTSTSTPPAQAVSPPYRTHATGPIRRTTQSPASRPAVIAIAKPVYARAASPGSALVTLVRYTALQSPLAPSANTPQNPTSPISSTARDGNANSGGRSLAASGPAPAAEGVAPADSSPVSS